MFAQKSALTTREPRAQRSSADQRVAADRPTDALSLAEYAARRSYAFDEAEATFWSGTICAESYMLFRLLTRLCKDRTYCWPGLDYLAGRLQASVGTVKRRLDQLERAGLIERRQRPGGLTSYTYVMPLQRYDADPQAAQPAPAPTPPMPETGADRYLPAASTVERSKRQTAVRPVRQPRASSRAPLFFVPQEGISAGPPDRSALISQTIKSPTLNVGGGGDKPAAAEGAAEQVTALLEQSGVVSPQVLAELQHLPLVDVAACLSFARRQPNIVDPAAFAVSLLRQGLGSRLVHRPCRPAAADDPAGYRQYHCRHGQVRGSCAACTQPEQPTIATTAADVGSESSQLSREATVWRGVLAELKRCLSSAEFSTWLGDTALLHLERDQVVIGTPNILVRERLASTYEQQIAAALATALGRQPMISYAIGSS